MKQLSALLLTLCLLTACEPSHFITDKNYRQRVEQDFQQRKEQLPQGDLFATLNTELTDYEREALTFLYAYMPLADIADYSGDFHLMNIRAAQQAAQEMPWGKKIPEELFRHFVLPVRVNNEPLDSARIVFYQELKERVAPLSMKDAILEVNHWCHEKAVYTPSDARTSSPLATVRTAYGRCGEESTLLVAALRSVGIPARQVYTPRWAHTDSNHAWVEAWADGNWYFLGACEPEPVLNLGWFNAPASRGMLMHTKVFGHYEGPEEIMLETPRYTEINIIGNYAPTATASITVTDASGKPVPNATVEFKLYNYAEFFTVATKQTEANGRCSLTAGKGDLLVWASKEGRFGFGKCSFGKDNTLTVVLDKQEGDAYAVDFDIVPPMESANLPEVTPEQRAENDRRMAYEDSIRNAYTATFTNEAQAREFAHKQQLDENMVTALLTASRGNHATLTDFISTLDTEPLKKGGMDLLQRISEKDLRDVPTNVLADHLQTPMTEETEILQKYLRNPRIHYERLTPYKAFFAQAIAPADAANYQADPMKLANWVAQNITIDQTCNLGSTAITPAGVWKARAADALSRNIFFVALARSLGIPARIHEVTGQVQIFKGTQPIDIRFDCEQIEEVIAPQGTLVADYQPSQVVDNPKYYTHFSLSKLLPNGQLQLLTYPKSDASTWSNLLKNGSVLDAGSYVLVTGTRLANGGVLARMTSFTIRPDQRTDIDLVMRESSDKVQVIGNFNSESLFTPATPGVANQPTTDKQSILGACGRGYFVVGILGVNQEPTNHALRDIAALKADLEQWNRTMVLLFPNEEQISKFKSAEFPALPSTVVYGIDTEGIAAQIAKEMKLSNSSSLPIFIIADTFNRVVFVSQGYTIGMGEQIMKTVKGL